MSARIGACLVAMLLALAPAARADVSVQGDDAGDRFVGTGGVLLPGSAATPARRTAATCADCRWRMTDPCAFSSTLHPDASCLTVPQACAEDGSRLLRAFISRDGGETWEYLGLYCIPPRGPEPVARLGDRVRESFERAVPAGSIAVQPAVGAIVRLPVTFDSGQPAVLPPSTVEIAGHRVTLTPRATFRWDFGDGATLVTDRAGSRYPDLTVSHAYREDGVHLVRLRTTWTATYLIDGIGPLAVAEPVTQDAALALPIGQARGVLVP